MLFFSKLLTVGLLALAVASPAAVDSRGRHDDDDDNDHGHGHGGPRCHKLDKETLDGDRARTISLRRGQTSRVLGPEYTAYTGCWAGVRNCGGRAAQGYGDVKMQMTFDSKSSLLLFLLTVASVKAYLVSMDSANGELELTYPVVNSYAAYLLVPKPGAKIKGCGYQSAVMINTTQTTTSGMTWYARPADPPQPAIGAGTKVTDGSALFRVNSVT